VIKTAGGTALSPSGARQQVGDQAWFGFWGGNVVVKNPDSEILRKMYVIAQSLFAKVQGDEGETYGPDGNLVV
jgi:hypothetical protein